MTVSWETLDAAESVQELADILRQAHVTGIAGDPERCPLAVATGWYVTDAERSEEPNECVYEPLTEAEKSFIKAFDNLSILDLLDAEAREEAEHRE